MSTRTSNPGDALPDDRTAGVCLHVTSLPGRYGVGEIGDSAFEFIDSIHRENAVTLMWRLSSSNYAGEFLGLLTLQKGEKGVEITAVSVN